MIIVADNGMETQTRKLKDGITLDGAKAQVRKLWEDDWLGLDYRLEDNDGNVIFELEHDDQDAARDLHGNRTKELLTIDFRCILVLIQR